MGVIELEKTYELLERTSDYSFGDADYMAQIIKGNLRAVSTAQAFTNGTRAVYVRTKDDFPTAVNGVITLANKTTYFIADEIFLGNDRLVCGVDTVILGYSSENSRISSNVASPNAIIFSEYSLPMRHISISNTGTGLCFHLDGDGVNNAHDWFGVNFLDGEVGLIGDVSNFVVQSIFCNSNCTGGFKFDGALGTISFRDLLYTGTNYGIEVTENAAISRRLRVVDSSFVATSGNNAIRFSASASVPAEQYILRFCNFGGGGTYLTGVNSADNKANFEGNVGITNSAKVGGLTMQGNAVATTVSATETYYKLAGTTTALSNNQKFSHTNNRITYTGAITEEFSISGTASIISGNNNEIGLTVFKNGLETTGFETKSTANAGGRAENISFFWVGELANGDYLEVFAENYSAITNITAESLFYRAIRA